MVVQMGGRAAAAERQRSLGHGGREIEEEEEKEEEEGRQGEGGSGLQAYGANRAQTVIGGGRSERGRGMARTLEAPFLK